MRHLGVRRLWSGVSCACAGLGVCGARDTCVPAGACRVTTDPKAVQSKSSSGHDSWTLSSTGLYHRINGTYCGPHARTLAADAWAYTGDVTEAACLAACEKVHCTCFDTK